MLAKNSIYLLIIVNNCIRLAQAAKRPPATANFLGSTLFLAGKNMPPIHPDIYQDSLLPAVSFVFVIQLLAMLSLKCRFFTATFIT